MNDFLYKHVLFKDLQEYLKRTDYFDGYTPVEKSWIRTNLGLISGDETKALIDGQISGLKVLSYTKLLSMINECELVPGFLYVIEDFLTIYQSNEKNSDGKYITYGKDVNPSEKYCLITIACDLNKLLSTAYILGNDKNSLLWDVKYDVTLQILDDGNVTKGKIIYLKDENNNQASYDFKNIIGEHGYTFQNSEGLENSKNCKGNDLTDSTNIYLIGNCNYNVIRGNNIYIKLPINYFMGELNNVIVDSDLFNTNSIKLSFIMNDKYYIDYLDLETLTHLFYAIDTVY